MFQSVTNVIEGVPEKGIVYIIMKRLCLTVFFLAVFALGTVCHADIYRYKDDTGVFHFTNIPPVNKEYRAIVYADKQFPGHIIMGSRSRQPWGQNERIQRSEGIPRIAI